MCFFLLWPLPALSHEAGNLYGEALSAVESQDFNKAKRLLEQAIQEFPAFPEAHHLYGLVKLPAQRAGLLKNIFRYSVGESIPQTPKKDAIHPVQTTGLSGMM